MLKLALSEYLAENTDSTSKPDQLKNLLIKKTAKGKPYLADSSIHFSISHTDGLWACIVGPAPCGLDVQTFGRYHENDIAKRLFSDADAEYVNKNGTEGFYKIWSRFEAIAKYDGSGIFASKPMLSDGYVTFDEVIMGDEKRAFLRDFCERDFDVETRLAGALCTGEPAEIIFRRLHG